NLSCTVAAPATDSAFVSAGSTECGYNLRVENSHNKVDPQSSLTQITISIPNNSGQLIPTGSSALWDFSNTTPTQIKFQAPGTDPGMLAGSSQEVTFLFVPSVP